MMFVCSFWTKEIVMSYKWSRTSVWSSQRLPLLVTVCDVCTARWTSVDGILAVVKQTPRCPGGLSSLPVDDHCRPWSANQRQPGGTAAVPTRRDRPTSASPDRHQCPLPWRFLVTSVSSFQQELVHHRASYSP